MCVNSCLFDSFLYSRLGIPSYVFTALLNIFVQNAEYKDAKAVITKPVVDMSSSYPLCYQPPISGQDVVCRRANQGLYNELVECKGIVANAVKFDYERVMYGCDPVTGTPYSTMWADVHGLKLIKEVDSFLLPMIPDMQKQEQKKLCLRLPWHQFSVGTCFVRVSTSDIDDSYAVYVPAFQEHTYAIAYIPVSCCLLVEQRSLDQARALFVELLFGLIAYAQQVQSYGVVPYVWGGCSFVTPNDRNDFILDNGVWDRPCVSDVYSGYDCSGLIWRLAQCAGIPFIWKVTKIMQESCRPVTPDDPLQEGDIIWFAGHTMVVADLERNLLIEAAGYQSGYGCVCCMALQDRFAGIHTYDDLLHAYYNQQPIELLNNDGKVAKKIVIKLLKLTPPYI
jgi:hypothetical protein